MQTPEWYPADATLLMLPVHADVLITCLQAFSNYLQWIMLIVSLPVSRMPWSPHSGDVAKQSITEAWRNIVYGFNVLFGRAASLDCLLQAWGVWQRFTAHDIASSVLFRAAVR